MRKLLAAAIAALVFAAPVVNAQAPAAVDPKAVAAVKDLLEAINYSDMVKRVNAEMSAKLPGLIRAAAQKAIDADSGISAEQRKEALAELDRRMPKIVAMLDQVMTDPQVRDEIMDAMPALYARHFTVEEIQEMSRFYRTSAGAKTLTMMPQMMAESMQLSQQILAPRIKAMYERIKQDMAGNSTQGK